MHKCSEPAWDDEVTLRGPGARGQHAAQRFEHTLPGLGDRRRLSRRRFEADVLVHPVEGDLPGGWTITEDISRRGMFIAAAHQYPLRTRLALTLRTEYGDLALTGMVVHRVEGVGFGCEFIEVNEHQREALSFLVAMSRERASTPVQ
jgi:hypothetical protein